MPDKVRRQLPGLLEGHFVQRAENVLAFGLPGRGKTHFVAALGRGIFSRARHKPGMGAAPPAAEPGIAVPLDLPVSPLNHVTLRAFNTAYFHQLGRNGRRAVSPI